MDYLFKIWFLMCAEIDKKFQIENRFVLTIKSSITDILLSMPKILILW